MALVPFAVVTVTPTVPTAPAGAVAVRLVADVKVTAAAAAVPNFTVLAAVKFVPEIVTTVPPSVGPVVGAMAVTVGAAGSAVTLKTTVPAAGTSDTAAPSGVREAPVTPSVALKATLQAPTKPAAGVKVMLVSLTRATVPQPAGVAVGVAANISGSPSWSTARSSIFRAWAVGGLVMFLAAKFLRTGAVLVTNTYTRSYC